MTSRAEGPGVPPAAAAVRASRGPKASVDPTLPAGVEDETEVAAPGVSVRSRVVFLVGAECPFTCAMCDLWRHTLDGPTPPGALPAQLRAALSLPTRSGGPPTWVKLYNASNFTDPRAVPPDDLPEIAALVADFERVVVETHPSLVDGSLPRFAAALGGRLEVAMGLETADPDRLRRLGKGMTRDDFASAAARLVAQGIDVRAFVLVGLPDCDDAAALDLALDAVRFAAAAGARHVSLIPTRPGNGHLDRLAAAGRFRPVAAATAEAALERALAASPRSLVTLDLWDWPLLAGQCDACRAPRAARIAAMNLAQRPLDRPAVACGCATAVPSRAPAPLSGVSPCP